METSDDQTKTVPAAGDKINSNVTILRPRSPTKCSTEERGLMEFVERGIKDSFNAGVPCPWEDIVCAFSATFLFRSPSGAFIPDVDMQMYWCNFCNFKSKEKREMINHSMTHRFKCNYCNQEFFSRADVVKHSIRKHPEYKLTRQALKACMFLKDLLQQDETSILFGGQKADNDEKTDKSWHLECDQQNTNSNIGGIEADSDSSSSTVTKVSGSYSVYRSEENSTNATLPLSLSASEALVALRKRMAESDSNGTTNTDLIFLPQTEEQNTGGTTAGDDSNTFHPLVSSTDESGLQIIDVQSAADLEELIPTPQGDENTNMGESINIPAAEQQSNETIQLLEGLIDQIGDKKKKESVIEDVAVTPGAEPTEQADNNLSKEKEARSKRKTAPVYTELSSEEEEDSDADPDYQPAENKWMRTERSPRFTKKRKIETQPTSDFLSNEKKLPDPCSLTVGTPVWRCGYCKFRALRKRKIEEHVNEKHSQKIMKYTKLVVNSSKELVPEVEPEKPKVESPKPFSIASSSKTKDIENDDDNSTKTKDKYSCLFCSYQSADVQTIRPHMFRLHPSEKFCCTDNHLKKKKKQFHTFFCCRHKCNFVSVDPQDYIDHAEKCTPLPKPSGDANTKPTGLQQTVTFAKKLQSSKRDVDSDCVESSESDEDEKESKKDRDNTPKPSERKAEVSKDATLHTNANKYKDEDTIEKNTTNYMPAYECLYCEASCISTSLMNMKRHVQDHHPNETIIVRDCVAYKRKKPSRLYVCDASGCIFNDLDYKEYLIHNIAHKGGLMYECVPCNWVSREQKEYVDHVSSRKRASHSLTATKLSMKEDGSIVKKTV